LQDIPSDYDDDGWAPPQQFQDNLGSYMAVDPDWAPGMENEGSYLGVDPAGNPGSYMAVDPHAKQFVGGGSAGGRKKQPKKKASNPGSYMAVDPEKFQGDGNPGSYFEMAPDGDDGDSRRHVHGSGPFHRPDGQEEAGATVAGDRHRVCRRQESCSQSCSCQLGLIHGG
jgi:hypothetical protein